jgi:DNA-binding response OmpR family regulator
MAYKMLIVDDDLDIREMLANYFSREGYEIDYAADGQEGLEKVKQFAFSIILLDIMMPNMDGYRMLVKLREFCDTPVILLTAKGEQFDKINGFVKGCDDYVVKPFDLAELSLRILAILKRVSSTDKSETEEVIYVKDIEINLDEHTVIKDGEEIVLTPKEFEILTILASNKGRVYSTKMLYEFIWKEPFFESDNSVIVHIRNIREKLGDKVKEGKYIKTIWGMGYKVEKDT